MGLFVLSRLRRKMARHLSKEAGPADRKRLQTHVQETLHYLATREIECALPFRSVRPR